MLGKTTYSKDLYTQTLHGLKFRTASAPGPMHTLYEKIAEQRDYQLVAFNGETI